MSIHRLGHGTDSIIAIGGPLDEFEVLLGTDHRARVPRERHHWKRAEHGVDGTAFESELAQMRPVEE
jgi:hypothetical protein